MAVPRRELEPGTPIPVSTTGTFGSLPRSWRPTRHDDPSQAVRRRRLHLVVRETRTRALHARPCRPRRGVIASPSLACDVARDTDKACHPFGVAVPSRTGYTHGRLTPDGSRLHRPVVRNAREAVGRIWEDSAENDTKRCESMAVTDPANFQFCYRMGKSGKPCNSLPRTAKPPFVGSIPTGASVNHKKLGPPSQEALLAAR
jgi:hypothetical protein